MLEIRDAAIGELGIVHRIMRQAFEEYRGILVPESGALRESLEDIEKKVSNGGGAILAWDRNEPVGSAQYYYTNEYMYIGRVSVLPSHRGKGIGRKMIFFLENKALNNKYRLTKLEVRSSIPENIKYYQSLNYRAIEHIHYPDGTDSWYVMVKQLAN